MVSLKSDLAGLCFGNPLSQDLYVLFFGVLRFCSLYLLPVANVPRAKGSRTAGWKG